MSDYEKLQKRIKELEEDKEEHKKLQGFYDIKKKKLAESQKKCFHLEQENEKLKNQNEYLWTPVCAEDYIRLQKQYDELEKFKTEYLDLECELSEEICYLKKKNEELSSKIRTYLSLGPSQSVN